MKGRSSKRSRLVVGMVAPVVLGCAAAQPSIARGGATAAASTRTAPLAAPTPQCVALAPLFRPLVEQRWLASASLALLRNGELTVCSFGRVAGASDAAASPDTLYEIGSLTKLFTGLLLAEESERGVVRLDEPVTELLPVPVRSAERPITLLDLATQRSGLPRMPNNLAPRNARNPYADYDEARLFDYLRGVEPAPAGAKYQYSNLGAALLGDALARRAQQPYEALLRERVLAPLGMNDTYFGLPAAAEPRFTQGHDADDVPQHRWDFDVFAPAGALRSSARDMAKFLVAALPQAGTPLSSAFVAAQAPRADARAGRRIGLFFQTRSDGSVWHNGQTGGFASYFAVDPAARSGVVLLLSTTFARADELGDRVLAYARGQALVPFDLPPSFELSPQKLADYTGDYDLSADFSIHVERSRDALYARATGQHAFKLWPSAPDHFYLRPVDARLTFERDGQGPVTALVLDQGGEQQRASRRSP